MNGNIEMKKLSISETGFCYLTGSSITLRIVIPAITLHPEVCKNLVGAVAESCCSLTVADWEMPEAGRRAAKIGSCFRCKHSGRGGDEDIAGSSDGNHQNLKRESMLFRLELFIL